MKESNEIKVAILATNGFEEVEVTEPRKALDDAGMKTHLVSPEENTIRAWDESDWGEDYEVDVPLKKADSGRSEEHTSELQSRGHLVCRLLLEKKNKMIYSTQSRRS